jgi:tripartite-type tricarboxylate transporter receptor subunit TctC
MRWTVIPSILAVALACIPQTARADDFPTHPVRIIVPYAAGGPSDTGARLVSEGMSRVLGQSVIIENRGGGGGLNGTESFLTGELDGHTILLGGIAPLTIIPWIRKVSYVPERDFVPLGIVWRSAQTLVVRASLGVKTLEQFVAYAKQHPDKVTIGSAGIGTVSHLGALLLQREADIKLVHVPFRSTSQSLPLLIGDSSLDGLFGDAVTLAPQVAAGKIIPLAVAAPQRNPALPDTPTMAEGGFPGVEAEGWHGLVVSAQTPPDHVKRLRDALVAAQSDPGYQERLKQQGATVGEIGPDAYARLIKSDSAKWGAIIKAANLTVE